MNPGRGEVLFHVADQGVGVSHSIEKLIERLEAVSYGHR